MKRQGTDIEYNELLYSNLKDLWETYWYIVVLEYPSTNIGHHGEFHTSSAVWKIRSA